MSDECRQIDMELDGALSQNASARLTWKMSEKALSHLTRCERCRLLYHWLLDGVVPTQPTPALAEAVRTRMKQSLAPVTPQSSPRVLAAQFLLVFLLFSAPMVGIMGTAGLHEMNLTQLFGIVTVLVCGAALLSFSLAWQMSPGSLHRVPPRIAVIALAAGFLAATAVLFPWQEPRSFLERGWSCLKAGLLMAAASALLFWVLVRRGHTLASGMMGASLGAIAGLVGASVLQFTCNRQDAMHLLVWHGGVVIVSLILGVAISWGVNNLLRPRP
ncbi:MAG: NrsF family protein [Bryobacteraceae bacterium]|nr:NrsF family protein [Bryobacteraceae bacterium]